MIKYEQTQSFYRFLHKSMYTYVDLQKKLSYDRSCLLFVILSDKILMEIVIYSQICMLIYYTHIFYIFCTIYCKCY